jgi:hypothetical protein
MGKPSFHVFFPRANARDSVGWVRVCCAMRGVAGVAIVSLRLEKKVSEGASQPRPVCALLPYRGSTTSL